MVGALVEVMTESSAAQSGCAGLLRASSMRRRGTPLLWQLSVYVPHIRFSCEN